jgi:hypothetical protein
VRARGRGGRGIQACSGVSARGRGEIRPCCVSPRRAIRVDNVWGETVGYLPRDAARVLAPLVDARRVKLSGASAALVPATNYDDWILQSCVTRPRAAYSTSLGVKRPSTTNWLLATGGGGLVGRGVGYAPLAQF